MLRKSYSWIALATLILLAFAMSGCGGSEDVGNGGAFDVSGKVVDENNEGVSGVVISFGDKAGTVTTGSDGGWAQSNLTGSVVVTPQSRVYEFEPASRTVSAAAP